ncbi:MAG: Signal transduction histidine kinase [Myxococcales bacterium]|nr:Signal transduction histidine kinase [Myxococcales bacterium]
MAAVVYVVDDDALVTDSLSRALSLETEWEVVAFNEGARALAEMPRRPPDAVLSDFKMPGMDGLVFLGRVRAQHPDAVLMLLTGYADKESAIRAINEVGIWQYVEKPWDLGDLILKIRQGLERRALVGELREKNQTLAARLGELEKAHDELVRAERLAAVGRVASGLAHEIGNQLALVGYAEAIRDRSVDPEVASFAEVIVAAQRRLAALVDEIKDFARGAAAGYAREPGDVAAAVEEALGILRFDADVKARRVNMAVRARPLGVIHRGKITQVVVNLVRNAAQASAPGGEVDVFVDADGDGAALIRVRDRGSGMAPDVVARLGEPFFTTKERGSGLGLGISRRVIDEHGGTIDIQSDPGVGTEVLVTLPPLPASKLP